MVGGTSAEWMGDLPGPQESGGGPVSQVILSMTVNNNGYTILNHGYTIHPFIGILFTTLSIYWDPVSLLYPFIGIRFHYFIHFLGSGFTSAVNDL